MAASMDDLVLAAFLREEAFAANFSGIVQEEMFSSYPHKICISAYITYTHSYSSHPSQTEMNAEVQRYCRKFGLDENVQQIALTTLLHVYEITYNLEYVRDEFVKFATRNKTTSAILEAASIIKSKGEDITEKDYGRIQDMMTEALSIKSRDAEGILLSDVAEDPVTFIQNQNRYDPAKVVRTGFRSIDSSHMAGGPIPGELYVVTAPPGQGKSTFLVNIGASALLQGKDVIHIFVGDNTEADGVLRYTSRLTGVSMTQIMMNSSQYLPAWKYLRENFMLGQMLIGAFSIGGPSVHDIRSFVTRVTTRAKLNPAVLIVDYVDNCRRDESKSSYEALGDIYKKLKNMSEELQLITWTASQPKIDHWDDDELLGLGSLAESSQKQAIIDGLFTMKRRGEDRVQVHAPKFRRGTSGFTIELLSEYEKMFMKEALPIRTAPTPAVSAPAVGADVSNLNLPQTPFAGT